MDPNYYSPESGRMIDLDVLREEFDEYLDDVNPSVEAGGASLKMSAFLKAADRPAYDFAFNAWADSEVKDGRLSVGRPEVEWSVTYTVDKTTTSPLEAARMAAAELAGSGQAGGIDGYAWRGMYDVTGPDGTTYTIDLETAGSGRVCQQCGGVDDDETWASEDGLCYRQPGGVNCGGLLVWPGHPVLEPGAEFTCECGERTYPLVRPATGDDSTWCECGRRIDDQRAAAQARKDES